MRKRCFAIQGGTEATWNYSHRSQTLEQAGEAAHETTDDYKRNRVTVGDASG
jgi:hypothetical protein